MSYLVENWARHRKKDNDYLPTFTNHNSNHSSVFGKIRNETDLLIVFFAVPKTGSRSLSNPFNVLFTSTLNYSFTIVPMDQRKTNDILTSYLLNMHEPAFIRGHFPVVQLPRNYVGISVLRDPLERFISEFNFVKYGDGQINASKLIAHTAPDFLLTLDECVQQKSPFCSREVVSSFTLSFFCGFDKRCRVANEWTYRQATKNVEEKFVMVGVTEELDNTIKLLERLLPNMANGVEKIYNQKQKVNRQAYVTHTKEQPSPRIRDKLLRMMYWEYKFYYHVKSKFLDLKKMFGLPKT
ncbi:putative uronyl 2-sulfotransferase [Apostichopus japonicus]|uniref:Putative uronyl 2-sulfotransferase n=1 Tax=Stichopus japonicus TaxID=307972 RepID=A0A2G8KN07_STIJA|nr:putative uronyl 2-sulfotransferase [Apostichopus japonicus]